MSDRVTNLISELFKVLEKEPDYNVSLPAIEAVLTVQRFYYGQETTQAMYTKMLQGGSVN